MKDRHEGEAERWILHARDEFADADELRKTGKYSRDFDFVLSTSNHPSMQGLAEALKSF
jgi:hypothetical protein